ncbi:hypothetical protein MNEG_11148, partial [Monoraphidium neglectum]
MTDPDEASGSAEAEAATTPVAAQPEAGAARQRGELQTHPISQGTDYSPYSNPFGNRPSYRTSAGVAASMSSPSDLPTPEGAPATPLPLPHRGGPEADATGASPVASDNGSNVITPGSSAAGPLSPGEIWGVSSPDAADTAGSTTKPRAAAAPRGGGGGDAGAGAGNGGGRKRPEALAVGGSPSADCSPAKRAAGTAGAGPTSPSDAGLESPSEAGARPRGGGGGSSSGGTASAAAAAAAARDRAATSPAELLRKMKSKMMASRALGERGSPTSPA